LDCHQGDFSEKRSATRPSGIAISLGIYLPGLADTALAAGKISAERV
jgi:hypothetical protein